MLSDRAISLGRGDVADLRLEDDTQCSRLHCQVQLSVSGCIVTDMNSRNGTWVGDARITAPVTLQHGQEFRLGDSVVVVNLYRDGGSPPDTIAVSGRDLSGTNAADIPQIPGYQTLRVIGHGANGVVAAARRESDNQIVAIKFLLAATLEKEQQMALFSREASISMRLRHSAIIKTLDFGIHEECPYLVMEYLQQANIDRILEKKTLEGKVRIISGMATRLLAALGYAHSQKIVHRDVKPGNVIPYIQSGKLLLKLGDFGLAKNYTNAGLTDVSHMRDIKGTIAFMPPEQIKDSRHVGPASDLYSVGACLYFWVSGKYPYEFDNVSQGLDLVLNESPVPLRHHAPGVSEGFVEIIERAMAKNPAHRYPDAASMQQDLQPYRRRDWNQPAADEPIAADESNAE